MVMDGIDDDEVFRSFCASHGDLISTNAPHPPLSLARTLT